MPTITKIQPQRRNPDRRNIYLDGTFAFGLNLNVVARFRLVEGLRLSDEQVRSIEQGEVRQECFDSAMRFIQQRLHSREQLRQKLARKEFTPGVIEGVLDDLQRMEYVNDERFAAVKAQYACQQKRLGRRRAMMELRKAGIDQSLAERALAEVYDSRDSAGIAKALAMKQAPRLRKLEPLVARRRLGGMLARRGFDMDTIREVTRQVLGAQEFMED